MTPELKPCPFCSEKLEVDRFNIWTHPSNDCLLATIDEGVFPLMICGSREIEKWNRRVNPLEDKKIRSCSLLVDGEPVSFSGEELLSILTEAGRLKKGKGDYNGT